MEELPEVRREMAAGASSLAGLTAVSQAAGVVPQVDSAMLQRAHGVSVSAVQPPMSGIASVSVSPVLVDALQPPSKKRRSKPSTKLFCGHTGNIDRSWCLTPQNSATGYSDHRAHRRHEERHVIRLGLCPGNQCPACYTVSRRWKRTGKHDNLISKEPAMGKRVKIIVDEIKKQMKVNNVTTALDKFCAGLPPSTRNAMIRNAIRRQPELLEQFPETAAVEALSSSLHA